MLDQCTHIILLEGGVQLRCRKTRAHKMHQASLNGLTGRIPSTTQAASVVAVITWME